jgi:ATP-binding cassette subfamily B protein
VHRADTIMVMEAGKVIEQGPHAELLERPDGGYRRLYDFQLLP